MDNEFEQQVQTFIKLWHRIFNTSSYKKLIEEYKLIGDLSTSEISIISMVAQNKELVLKDIVIALDLPKSTLTSMLNRLEKKGFLKRVPGTKDKRSYSLELTAKGEEAERQHKVSEEFVYSTILKSIETEEKRKVFMSLMTEIIENLEKE